MQQGYRLEGETIIIDRDLTTLDILVRDFLDVLIKYSDYLVVSGFVSIASGRTRGTEDIDILFPVMKKDIFLRFFTAVQKKGFWCYQSDDAEQAYEYAADFQNIRFARINEMFPNIEFVPINKTKKAKFYEFTHPQKIKIKDFEFKIPPLEFEILYKEIILAGKKDVADALHLRTFFSRILKKEKFREYEPIIRGELK